MKDSYRNPFDGINASQLNDLTILNYWCNPFNYKFFSDLREEDIYSGQLNTVIVGGRSSGKTMLLRYCSFGVQYQKALSEGVAGSDIIKYFLDKGGIGIYKRIDGSALNDFNSKNIDAERKMGIFAHYFEMNICYEYLEVINTLNSGGHLEIGGKFYSDLAELLGERNIATIQDALAYIDTEIKKVDDFRSKMPFYSELNLNANRIYASNTLSYGLPSLLVKSFEQFRRLNFILFIDEFENFAGPQQRMVNTLLKFTKPNIKFRISMRPEGFNTRHTVSDSDVIEEGREYKEVNFDNVTLKNSDYEKFIVEVCRKRLENVKAFKDSNKTDITSFLGLRENLEEEALELTSKSPGRHFLSKKFKGKELDQIKNPSRPLLEMLNILWLNRGIPVIEVAKAMNDYLTGKVNVTSKKYKMDYVDKYKLSLMFLLASAYRKTKMYYSFRTFSFLSFGMVGHFLELCNEAFKYAAFEDRDSLIQKGSISKEAQNKAAFEVSTYQLRKASTIPYYGNLIYQFVSNLGSVFQYYHLDSSIKYPETNQFSVDYLLIKDDKCKEAFRHAIRWSVVQKKRSKQRPVPSKNKTDIFTINRVFSPVFEITYRTRGGYSHEIAPDEIVKYMTTKIEPSKEVPVKENRNPRKAKGSRNKDQTELF